jgi:hypothetical protein
MGFALPFPPLHREDSSRGSSLKRYNDIPPNSSRDPKVGPIMK